MKNKTYSEAEGFVAFDWKKALSADEISPQTWDELQERAGSWVTCACGNQCAIIPRLFNGKPQDKILALLGGVDGFYGAIKLNEKENALEILEMIEMRSAHLIKKLKKKK